VKKLINFNEQTHKKDLIAEGGEGMIYVYKNDKVIKIYKNHVDKKVKLEKLKRIMKKNLPSNIATPLDLVYDNQNNFIGFMMKKIEGEELKRLSSKRFVISNNITKEDITKMLIQIKNSLLDLHKAGMCIGDLNDMNILFDKNFQVFFIDIDSWSVDDDFRCTVANDLFKDPLLIKNYFTPGTDNYAFAILLYKALTRLHPFGGVIKSNPNISTTERMKKCLSVFSVDDLVRPPMVDKDVFLSSKLIADLQEIFINGKRNLINGSLDDFKDKLIYCDDHNDYYYSLFNRCPICELDAKEFIPISKVGTVEGIPIRLMFSNSRIKMIFDENTFIDTNNYINFRNSQIKKRYTMGNKYYSNNEGDIIYNVKKNVIIIETIKKHFEVEKLFNSRVVFDDNLLYYVSKGLQLIKFGLFGKNSSYEEQITRISVNNIFDVIDSNTYFICNIYDNTKILDISGYNHEFKNSDKIMEYGLHYDEVSGRWLFVIQTSKGDFYTYVYDKQKGMVYDNDKIRYIGNLDNLCFNNNIIFKPADKKIVGLDYQKNLYKEFEVPAINEETNLIRKGKKFIAINEKEIYEIG
jgi:serine/threonine protein kinase